MMNKERQGEIALLYLKHKLQTDGMRLPPNIHRDIGNTAKALNIPVDEATEFAEIIVREHVEKTFPKKR